MYIGHSEEILKVLSPYWLEVIACVTVAAVSSTVVRFIMMERNKVLQTHVDVLETQVVGLRAMGEQHDELNKKVNEYWRASNDGKTRSSHRTGLVIGIVLVAAAVGIVVGAFGTRLYLAGPVGKLEERVRDVQSRNTQLSNQVSQIKNALPPKVFDELSQRQVKSIKTLDTVIFAPALLIGAVDNRYKLVANGNKRLHVLVEPISAASVQPDKREKATDF